ncbi:MAG: hypothetical protein K0U98_12635 [Deltaproteobacteria bacterium]|nr:hypothetical protein [Deltaproteobacteria bacterium]
MNPLGAIFLAKVRMARHSLAALRRESKLKVALVSLSTLLLWWGGFWLSLAAFGWLQRLGTGFFASGEIHLGSLIAARLLSSFAFALFVLLLFSNVLVHFATLYRSREVYRLVLSPVGWRTLFLVRFGEAWVLSSWASAFLGSPFLMAYGWTSQAPVSFYLALALVAIPFTLLPAALGAAVTVVGVRLLSGLGRKGGFVIAAGFILAVWALLRARLAPLLPGSGGNLETLVQAMGQTGQGWLPSQWAVDVVVESATGSLTTSFRAFALLMGVALVVLLVAMELARRYFYVGWSMLAGAPGRPKGSSRSGFLGRLESLLRPLPEPYRSMSAKDLRLFWRDPAQWSQFLIFFGVMAVYAANMHRTSPAYDPQFWRSLLTLLNGIVCMLVLATLTTRFVFPLISLEGRRAWILGLAPITYRQILRQKFWLGVVTTSVFSLGLTLLSSLRLELGARSVLVSLFTVVVANFALSGLAVGLGALFPNFEEDNPSRIVSGMGGTLNFILSLAFVVLAGFFQAIILQWSFVESRLSWQLPDSWVLVGGLGAIALLGAIACWLPLKLGRENLEQLELAG